jgi:hypothetical protein
MMQWIIIYGHHLWINPPCATQIILAERLSADHKCLVCHKPMMETGAPPYRWPIGCAASRISFHKLGGPAQICQINTAATNEQIDMSIPVQSQTEVSPVVSLHAESVIYKKMSLSLCCLHLLFSPLLNNSLATVSASLMANMLSVLTTALAPTGP